MSKEKPQVNIFKDKNTGEWIKELDSTKERIELDEKDKVITGMLDDLENLPYLFGMPDVAMCLCAAGWRKQREGEWKDGKCSVCGSKVPKKDDGKGFMWHISDYKANYCPNCGARMKGGTKL